jgi:hydrogenase maturation protease
VADVPPVLVIGVGSELRTDDAVGRRVVDQVAARRLDGVETRSLHQLTPELSADLGGRELVVFVDAGVDVAAPTVRPLATGLHPPVATHHLDPTTLLALAARLGWAPRAAVSVRVPVRDLAFGTRLSGPTREVAGQVAETVVALCLGALDDRSRAAAPTPGP